jgi:hypothetical protein
MNECMNERQYPIWERVSMRYEWMNEWMYKWMNVQMKDNILSEWELQWGICEWMNVWMKDNTLYEWEFQWGINEWANECTNEIEYPMWVRVSISISYSSLSFKGFMSQWLNKLIKELKEE